MLVGRTVYIVMTNVPHWEWSYRITERRRVIGSSPDAHIRMPDRFDRVSRRHAEVWTDEYGAWIRDLESRNGTCINGVWGVWVDHVPQAGIVEGDLIRLGGAEMKVLGCVDVLGRVRAPISDPDETPLPVGRACPGRALCRQLGSAEVEVLLWVSRGYHDQEEIGKLLHRSKHTVHCQLGSIFRKLNVHSCAELMHWLKCGTRMGPPVVFPGAVPGGSEKPRGGR